MAVMFRRLRLFRQVKATRWAALVVAILVCALSTRAQQQSRITRPVNNQQRVTLRGHVHPKARAEFDQGRVSPAMEIEYVTLNLAPGAAQQAALDQLLKDQQTQDSPSYHHWLTPEQYAERFGATDADIAKISAWAQSQGLNVVSVARGHNMIAVSGMASQVEAAFQTELHQYVVNGEMHFANATEPTVPAAMQGVITGIRGLHDFRMKARHHVVTAKDNLGDGSHGLVPDDFSTIYNVKALYAAGFDGTGQTLAIAGQTNINLSDINTFRGNYGLSVNPPTITAVPGVKPPGIRSGDLDEADLDLEWSGAIARNATIQYVYTQDVMNSVQYVVDQKLAPVVSTSYGSCEPETPTSDIATFRLWAQQGNAEGITWMSASGDSGAADCDDINNPGLSVDTPGSIPEVTSVGGTEFVEGNGTFWAATNDANGASALSYIPETVWNDSAFEGQPVSAGGGISAVFARPVWQQAVGLPNDNVRHVPDIAMDASNDHDGYFVETGGQLLQFGGTSVPTPIFAGIITLLNQYLVKSGSADGVGNVNPTLYALASSSPGVFHDITVGNNIVTVACPRRSTTCGAQPVGWNAAAGYDNASGLGSFDVNQLVTKWSSAKVSFPSSGLGMSITPSLTTMGPLDTLYLIVTVNDPSGSVPQGTVTVNDNGKLLGTAVLSPSTFMSRATLVVAANQLTDSNNLTATFEGLTATATVAVGVNPVTADIPAVTSMVNWASGTQTFAPGELVLVTGTNLAPAYGLQTTVPLPVAMQGTAVLVSGVACPILSVSANQILFQIPYEVAPVAATLFINNNGKVGSQGFTISATAPGIFTDANHFLSTGTTLSRSAQGLVFITGAGATLPSDTSGGNPNLLLMNPLPQPVAQVAVSIGGVPATVDSVVMTSDLVGIALINFTPGSQTPIGQENVVVTVGGQQSAAALLTITP